MLNKTAPMKTRDLVMVSLLTALIVVLALVPPIPVPLVPVPVTLQTLASCWLDWFSALAAPGWLFFFMLRWRW